MMPVDPEEVVDLVCLVYHEARNVRHPMDKELVQDPERYRKLVHGLASCPKKAWQQMEFMRAKAASTGAPEGIAKAFKTQYALSLAEIAELFEAPFWKHSRLGGNAWASISGEVINLVTAMSAQESVGQRDLYERILSMSHNTGKVCDKLKKLRRG